MATNGDVVPSGEKKISYWEGRGREGTSLERKTRVFVSYFVSLPSKSFSFLSQGCTTITISYHLTSTKWSFLYSWGKFKLSFFRENLSSTSLAIKPQKLNFNLTLLTLYSSAFETSWIQKLQQKNLKELFYVISMRTFL